MTIFQSPGMRQLHFASILGIDAKTALFDPEGYRQQVENAKDTSVTAEWTTLPIDHDNSSAGTYQNRFWANTDHYKPGGPVFVYDVGEASALDSAQFFLGNSSSFFQGILQEFNGVGLVWEHR